MWSEIKVKLQPGEKKWALLNKLLVSVYPNRLYHLYACLQLKLTQNII